MSLKKYNSKRNFNKTNEPKGKIIDKKTKNTKLKFCVQHHLARKDHYDFRLEFNGVLLSWAIPKGPSYNYQDKRLAVETENHPLDYLDFEGIIPQNNYGAGKVLLFDLGNYEMLEDFKKTYNKGYLKFKLLGKRLKGNWTLIKFKDNNWLLIKEKDNIKGFDNISNITTSIKSELTFSEIGEIEITHKDKVMFKNPVVTKQDIVNYYKIVFDKMYPYLKDRLISTVRAPKGFFEEKFFKKHFKENEFLLKKKYNNENYYYIDNINGLIKEVQLNSIEFHIWGSKVNSINYPDIMVFDLDPDEKLSINKIREGVLDLKKILDELNLKSYLKTSGGKGYHIVVPFNNNYTYNKFKKISEDISNILVKKYPDKYTNNIRLKNRKGKIFIDYFRNNKGSTFVCPYSLRIRKKCTVSMPIKWSELNKIKPDDITIKDAIKRLKRKDPWKDFFNNK